MITTSTVMNKCFFKDFFKNISLKYSCIKMPYFTMYLSYEIICNVDIKVSLKNIIM
jgi:hypothetical protein